MHSLSIDHDHGGLHAARGILKDFNFMVLSVGRWAVRLTPVVRITDLYIEINHHHLLLSAAIDIRVKGFTDLAGRR